MKIKLNKYHVLGTLPGSNPPQLAWHGFDVMNDSGMVEHRIDGNLRAQIETKNFKEYCATQTAFDGVEVSELKATTVAVHKVGKKR